jgi:hypothetical protein
MGPDIKTYWLTDRESQCDFDLSQMLERPTDWAKEIGYRLAHRIRKRSTQEWKCWRICVIVPVNYLIVISICICDWWLSNKSIYQSREPINYLSRYQNTWQCRVVFLLYYSTMRTFSGLIRFLSTPQRPDRIWGTYSPLSNGYWGNFPLGKAGGTWSWLLASI